MTQFLSAPKSFKIIHIVVSKESYLYSRKDTEYGRKIDTMKWLKSGIYWTSLPRTSQCLFSATAHITLLISVHLHTPVMLPSASPSPCIHSSCVFSAPHLLRDIILFIHSHSWRPSALLLSLVSPLSKGLSELYFLTFEFQVSYHRGEIWKSPFILIMILQDTKVHVIVTLGFYISSMVKVG